MCRFREDLQFLPLVPCFMTTFFLYYSSFLGFDICCIYPITSMLGFAQRHSFFSVDVFIIPNHAVTHIWLLGIERSTCELSPVSLKVYQMSNQKGHHAGII